MDSNIFINSKLLKLTISKVNCKKLEPPSNNANLKVLVEMNLSFDENRDSLGHKIIYSFNVECEENDEKKLFSLEYEASAIYQIAYDGNDISEKFNKSYNYFLRELYMTTLEYLNNTLFNMKVMFQLPLNLPEDIEIKFKKEKKERKRKEKKEK